jgi:hypothetical protein
VGNNENQQLVIAAAVPNQLMTAELPVVNNPPVASLKK